MTRTRHVDAAGRPRFTNRLAGETSPYLLQHAHNPVDWRPWGDDAFAEAKRRGVPVFLSIGYSTCHWCHVMEEESFEDEEVAATLNRLFVCIKVDREERPDVDGVYMAAVQALTGRGGWPMSVWLDDERRPFYAGTYFPARDGDRGAPIGFVTICEKLAALYADDRDRVAESAAEIVDMLRRTLAGKPAGDVPSIAVLDEVVRQVGARFDTKHGGLNPAPKFPSSTPVRALLRHHARTGATEPLHMATLTLEQMARGGLYDHVGGGFHRYSTDAVWLAPHFEKMLYDQALLAVAYLEAWQVTKRDDFRGVVTDILRYVARDMTSPDGAFWSATDADSRAPDGRMEEGRAFTWTPDELFAELDDDVARVVAKAFDVTPGGNWEGRSILRLRRPLTADEQAAWDRARPLLRRARDERPQPLRDEKVVAAWNGLMISAYARVGFAFDDDERIERAERAASFALDHMVVAGRLRRTWKDGVAKHAGTLDDHAFLCAGLLDLYEATGARRWLDAARSLDDALAQRFADDERGGFFLTPVDGEELLVREKPDHDGAEPSGNSVHAASLLRLAALTGDDAYRARGARCIAAFGRVVARFPLGMAELLVAVDLLHGPTREVAVVAPSIEAARPLLAPLRAAFLPRVVRALSVEGGTSDLALLAGRALIDGQAAAYVCERGACKLPVTTADELAAALVDVR